MEIVRKSNLTLHRRNGMSASPKATRTEVGLLYLTGLVQGLALVTFPAASSVFTSPHGYGFSSTRYGTMFLPQVLLAILTSSLSPKFVSRWGLKRVLALGVLGNLVAMSVLASSKLLMAAPDAAFGLLVVATGALGFGFGATVMALNTYAQSFFPQNPDRAVLALNALLGTGTALAPLFVSILLDMGVWWALPILVACALALILICVLKAPLQIVSSGKPHNSGASAAGYFRQLPSRFWLYAASIFLYGIVETLNGNWAALYLGLQRGVSAQGASLALMSFWAMVTIGRLLFAALSARVPVRWTYVILPALLVIAFQAVSRAGSETAGILAFGFAGLGCSAFLPLSISFGGDEFPNLATMMSGELIAFYQLGYGVAAFGTGPLRNLAGLPFSSLYSYGSAVAAAMGVLAWFLIQGNSGSGCLHRRFSKISDARSGGYP
jgi:MFS transporter, FHS family, glucose/mannose:H+ symporter